MTDIDDDRPALLGGPDLIGDRCPTCGGQGFGEDDRTCPTCGDLGVINVREVSPC